MRGKSTESGQTQSQKAGDRLKLNLYLLLMMNETSTGPSRSTFSTRTVHVYPVYYALCKICQINKVTIIKTNNVHVSF